MRFSWNFYFYFEKIMAKESFGNGYISIFVVHLIAEEIFTKRFHELRKKSLNRKFMNKFGSLWMELCSFLKPKCRRRHDRYFREWKKPHKLSSNRTYNPHGFFLIGKYKFAFAFEVFAAMINLNKIVVFKNTEIGWWFFCWWNSPLIIISNF